jgi:hypothetical protein
LEAAARRKHNPKGVAPVSRYKQRFVKPSRGDDVAPRFVAILQPEELQHRVSKEEAAIGGALAWMSVR